MSLQQSRRRPKVNKFLLEMRKRKLRKLLLLRPLLTSLRLSSRLRLRGAVRLKWPPRMHREEVAVAMTTMMASISVRKA